VSVFTQTGKGKDKGHSMSCLSRSKQQAAGGGTDPTYS